VLSTAYARYQDDFTSWLADAYVVKSSDLAELKASVAVSGADDVIPIVLAGGFGTRIRPSRPTDPSRCCRWSTAVLERVLRHLVANGLTEAVLVTYHDPARCALHSATARDSA